MSAEIFDKVNGILEEIKSVTITDNEALEAYRIKYLGTKNVLKPLFG